VATGDYQVVPRDQLKKRLVAQKANSYRRCYERSCQIEIGKELAAQKTLATQVIKLGSKCGITGTLFDLKRAAAERAATVRGGCSEDEIVTSLEVMVKKLAPGGDTFRVSGLLAKVAKGGGVKLGGKVMGRLSKATKPLFAVDFRSEPVGAQVFLDGRAICTTNYRVNLPKGTYELQVERKNYLTHKARITIDGRKVINIKLKISPEGHEVRKNFGQRTELVALEGLVGFAATTGDGGLVGGGVLQTVSVKWQHVFWSILEMGGFYGGENGAAFLLSRLGYLRYYGAEGQHQLRFGLGVGGGFADVDDGDRLTSDSSSALIFSPTVEYRFLSGSASNFGVGVRAFLPVGDFPRQPFALFLSMIVGWQTPRRGL